MAKKHKRIMYQSTLSQTSRQSEYAGRLVSTVSVEHFRIGWLCPTETIRIALRLLPTSRPNAQALVWSPKGNESEEERKSNLSFGRIIATCCASLRSAPLFRKTAPDGVFRNKARQQVAVGWKGVCPWVLKQ
jgi:hypothetical protein